MRTVKAEETLTWGAGVEWEQETKETPCSSFYWAEEGMRCLLHRASSIVSRLKRPAPAGVSSKLQRKKTYIYDVKEIDE